MSLERQEALTAVSLVSQVFWDVKLRRWVGGYRLFEVMQFLPTLLQNVGTLNIIEVVEERC
jgi:hypothetical protein